MMAQKLRMLLCTYKKINYPVNCHASLNKIPFTPCRRTMQIYKCASSIDQHKPPKTHKDRQNHTNLPRLLATVGLSFPSGKFPRSKKSPKAVFLLDPAPMPNGRVEFNDLVLCRFE